MAVVSDICGHAPGSAPTAMVLDGATKPRAESVGPIDTRSGGAAVKFYWRYGNGGSCDAPESGEHVVMQYKKTASQSWVDWHTFPINTTTKAGWQGPTTFSLPSTATGAADVYVRWVQSSFTTPTGSAAGASYDRFAIDGLAVTFTPFGSACSDAVVNTSTWCGAAVVTNSSAACSVTERDGTLLAVYDFNNSLGCPTDSTSTACTTGTLMAAGPGPLYWYPGVEPPVTGTHMARVSTRCGSAPGSPTTAMVLQGDGSTSDNGARSEAIGPVDARGGVALRYFWRYGNGGSCNAPESGEEVELQYFSRNSGSLSWTVLDKLSITTATKADWQGPTTSTIPKLPRGNETYIRWRQSTHSRSSNDLFAIDHVVVSFRPDDSPLPPLVHVPGVRSTTRADGTVVFVDEFDVGLALGACSNTSTSDTCTAGVTRSTGSGGPGPLYWFPGNGTGPPGYTPHMAAVTATCGAAPNSQPSAMVLQGDGSTSDNGDGARAEAIGPLDARGGATLSFYWRYGASSASGGCDAPEPGEEVVLQYFDASGSGAWTNLTTFPITFTTKRSWQGPSSYAVPSLPLSRKTYIRWRQANHGKGTSDRFAIDHLSVTFTPWSGCGPGVGPVIDGGWLAAVIVGMVGFFGGLLVLCTLTDDQAVAVPYLHFQSSEPRYDAVFGGGWRKWAEGDGDAPSWASLMADTLLPREGKNRGASGITSLVCACTLCVGLPLVLLGGILLQDAVMWLVFGIFLVMGCFLCVVKCSTQSQVREGAPAALENKHVLWIPVLAALACLGAVALLAWASWAVDTSAFTFEPLGCLPAETCIALADPSSDHRGHFECSATPSAAARERCPACPPGTQTTRVCSNGTTAWSSDGPRGNYSGTYTVPPICTPCPLPGNCRGGPGDTTAPSCNGTAIDSSSFLCSQCLEGHYPLLGACHKCPSASGALPIVLGLIAAAAIGFLIQSGFLDPKGEHLFRSLCVHMQLLNINVGLKVPWPAWTRDWVRDVQALFLDVGLYSPRCAMGGGWYLTFALTLVLFGALLSLVALGRVCIKARAKAAMLKSDESSTHWSSRLFRWHHRMGVLLATIALLGYAPVLRTFMQAMDCVSTPEGPVLEQDASIACDSAGHILLMIFAFCASLALGLVVPLALVLHFFRLRQTDKRRFDADDVWAKRLKPVVLPYRESAPYFEGFVMLHRALCVWMAVAFASGALQSIVVLLATALMAYGLIRLRPLKALAVGARTDVLNDLIIMAAVSQCVVLACGFIMEVAGGSDFLAAIASLSAAGAAVILGLVAAFHAVRLRRAAKAASLVRAAGRATPGTPGAAAPAGGIAMSSLGVPMLVLDQAIDADYVRAQGAADHTIKLARDELEPLRSRLVTINASIADAANKAALVKQKKALQAELTLKEEALKPHDARAEIEECARLARMARGKFGGDRVHNVSAARVAVQEACDRMRAVHDQLMAKMWIKEADRDLRRELWQPLQPYAALVEWLAAGGSSATGADAVAQARSNIVAARSLLESESDADMDEGIRKDEAGRKALAEIAERLTAAANAMRGDARGQFTAANMVDQCAKHAAAAKAEDAPPLPWLPALGEV